ncbi:lysine-specific demethylase JMJ28-like [Gastrolobium bilobum]|uniref:lysine-specific demethylase JMJ28-like n=1 Tax=Gastrolobium bilobum TaxID=150636 RepID=UPI002AB2074E|nr:lysine-specific demethylase JMJ28-like [Gastrolobium bilobum]
MGKKSAAAKEEEEEALPDHLRCGRTDGRQWRCRRRVMEKLKLCEIHYLQGRHRQFKEKVPESLKLQRKSKKNDPYVLNNVEIRARKACKMAKKKRKLSEGSEALVVGPARKKALKQGDMQLELIKMVLKREVEKRKKMKNNNNNNNNKKKKEEEEDDEEGEELNYSEGELRRELPNGVMAISPASTPHDYNNVGSHCDVKVGVDHKAVTPRYFRSKNVERVPVGKLQAVPYKPNLKKSKTKRKKCHWCQRSDSWNLIKCSSCLKEFFCMDCIKERYFDTQNEVKKACPVCRGTCTCKDCLESQSKDSESKEYFAGKSRVCRILHFHYLICMLLPVLKKISKDQDTELETEAKIKGKNISEIQIKQVEFGCNEKNYCNHCKTPVLDLHRSCPSCSYSLCLSCCQKLSQERTSGEVKSSMFKLPDEIKACIASDSYTLDENAISSGKFTDTSILPEWTNGNGMDSVSCLPTELGGCGNSYLDLRCIFPSSWIKEMEVKAEEIICSYDFPETSDKSSSCSLCFDTDQSTNRYKQLQEAAQREDSIDNCLFCPTVLDISGDNFEHFQKHWGKGHPIVVRDVLQSTSNLSWDPLIMFCTYLEQSITRYENNKDLLASCLEWCEVEINIRQYFTGSLKCRPQKNICHEMLKLKGWLSSQIFKEQFPAHFAEVIDALPVQEYMNPMYGLLNLAANLPRGSAKHDIGPYVYISYGCADKEADCVTKLSYDSYDVVNIMRHTTDVPLSTEQLTKIRKLLKKHKSLCHMESSIATEQLQEQKVKGITLLPAEDMEQKGLHSMVKEEMDFFRRVNRTSCISTEAKKPASQSLDSNISQDGECDFFSDSDSEPSLLLHSTVQTTKLPANHNPRNPSESSNSDKNKFTVRSGAQWDVFRRQDVPKLIEYLKRHHDEFSYGHNYHKKMVHPILDQSIFLDSNHKMRLKEEFKIEPWTFQQHVGEAVIIPAGCPYQIRNPKCCVHVALEFVSPENVKECIQLIDEVRLLPEDHKAKVDKLEVKKMALYSMSTAIKEIRELTCKT